MSFSIQGLNIGDNEKIQSHVEAAPCVLVLSTTNKFFENYSENKHFAFLKEIKKCVEADSSFGSSPEFICSSVSPGLKIYYAKIDSVNYDTDDVRQYFEKAEKLAKRALLNSRKISIMIEEEAQNKIYSRCLEVALLGSLSADYCSLSKSEHLQKLNKQRGELNITLLHNKEKDQIDSLVKVVTSIELGKRISKDLGGADQERMTPVKFAEYCVNSFEKYETVTTEVLTDTDIILKEYPLLHAVSRASLYVERHKPCVIKLRYNSPNQSKVKETLYFVGKGVTFDTGGADVKTDGVMRGMSRDKCGAATVAGFIKSVAELRAENINIVAYLGMVRNSVGCDSYLCDEIITSRAGKRVLIGNTDAEGRMVMTDLLAQVKEEALKNSKHSNIFTVATLTGHAALAFGPYSVALETGTAKKRSIAKKLFDSGLIWGDPFEISSLRREDFDLVRPGSDQEDVIQSNSKASSRTVRGHQFPMAFMIVASGIEECGLNAPENRQISYTHLDIAGSATGACIGSGIPIVTGNPLASLVEAFVLSE